MAERQPILAFRPNSILMKRGWTVVRSKSLVLIGKTITHLNRRTNAIKLSNKDTKMHNIQQLFHLCIHRQSSVKIPPIKNTSSNNTLHIFTPFLDTNDNPGYRKNRAKVHSSHHHFTPAYLVGTTWLLFIRLTELELSIHACTLK